MLKRNCTSVALCISITAAVLSLPARGQTSSASEHWVTAWGAAMHAPIQFPGIPPSPVFENQTIRMVVRPTLGGKRVRIRFSNAFGTAPLLIGAAHIALVSEGAKIIPESDHVLTFGGRASVSIPPESPMLSDPVDLKLAPFAELAVSIYLPNKTLAATGHFWAQHDSYISGPGDFTTKVDMPDATSKPSWYYLAAAEVWTANQAGATVALGDSITDGTGAKQGDYADWPDILASRLAAEGGPGLAVVNEGIGGNRILHDGAGISALARFDRDVLAKPGVVNLIVLEGINDIGWPHMKPPSPQDGNPPKDSPFAGEEVSAQDLITGLQQMIDRAHEHGIRIFGATLTPFEGADYYTAEGETVRETVNQWIRTSGAFDAVFDFDAAVRDPDHPAQFRGGYHSGDHLHPSALGYKAMANAVDLSVLRSAIPAGAQQHPASQNNVVVDNDGTVHVPAEDVPLSSFLSPEAKAYVTQHLKNMQNPQMVAQDNGVPRFMRPYLERQKTLYAVERQDTKIAGVHAYIYTPKTGIPATNRNRVLINLHGGGFSGCWPACAELESMPVSALGNIRVVSVDYREGPEYKFPAASEDVAAVYRELLKDHTPQNIGIYGCSAGGMLTAMSVAWFQKHDLPRPGAIGIFCAGAGSPTGVGFGGDAAYTALPLGEARMPPPLTQTDTPANKRPPGLPYLAGTDPKDPLVAPINSPEVMAKFPPTLIITGTRGFEMSGALYTHTQLVKLGVESDLHVWEGLFHGFFYNADVPESADCYEVIVKFFDRHLRN